MTSEKDSGSLTREQALQQAEAEGLTLMESTNKAGYFGVSHQPGRAKPYQAKVWSGGQAVNLGSFSTAEEAALCIARSPEGQKAAKQAAARAVEPPPEPLTREQALHQAEEEGITLRRANNRTGYANVSVLRNKRKAYKAHVSINGKTTTLGTFVTAEEAALCIARSKGKAWARGEQIAKRSAAPPSLSREQVLQLAQAEGVTLVRKPGNNSGYANVAMLHAGEGRSLSRPYIAQVYHNRQVTNLGTFATAEEAALCVARSPEGQAAAAAKEAAPMAQEARDVVIEEVALETIYQAAAAAAIELCAEVAAEVMGGITLGL